jgi:hypothetical protein
MTGNAAALPRVDDFVGHDPIAVHATRPKYRSRATSAPSHIKKRSPALQIVTGSIVTSAGAWGTIEAADNEGSADETAGALLGTSVALFSMSIAMYICVCV